MTVPKYEYIRDINNTFIDAFFGGPILLLGFTLDEDELGEMPISSKKEYTEIIKGIHDDNSTVHNIIPNNSLEEEEFSWEEFQSGK